MKFVTKQVPIEQIKPYEQNPRRNQDAVEAVAESIREFGFRQPLVCSMDMVIICGHTRWKAARLLGLESVPVHVVDNLTSAQERALRIADNKTADLSTWDDDLLAKEIQALLAENYDVEKIAFEDDELERLLSGGIGENEAMTSLSDRFGISPLTLLDARGGAWRRRKEGWLSHGIKSEIGRKDDITFSKSSQPPELYRMKNRIERREGRTLQWDEFIEKCPEAKEKMQSGVSIFDPVLCELAYRWFCAQGGVVLDPFAGGSVRGIVAALTGRQYCGVDLRKEQIEANVANWAQCQSKAPADAPAPEWATGDSIHIGKLFKGRKADRVFSCPPYADLEVYSDDPADLSNMSYRMFRQKYRQIIAETCGLLNENRFAVWVVGEVRGKDKGGAYRNFVGDTIEAFGAAGLSYYNEAILVTPFGSSVIRAGGMFASARKLCKVHQNVLVFVKGDPAKATEWIGACDFAQVESSEVG